MSMCVYVWPLLFFFLSFSLGVMILSGAPIVVDTWAVKLQAHAGSEQGEDNRRKAKKEPPGRRGKRAKWNSGEDGREGERRGARGGGEGAK
jgi:hypothetical protein